MEQKVTSPLRAFKDKESGKWGFVNDDKRFGFVDETGNLVIPCNFVHALDFRDGLARVQEEGTFKIGYINKKGETVIPFVYRKGGDFENGLAMVSSHNWFANNA